jgi:hypothetical protein
LHVVESGVHVPPLPHVPLQHGSPPAVHAAPSATQLGALAHFPPVHERLQQSVATVQSEPGALHGPMGAPSGSGPTSPMPSLPVPSLPVPSLPPSVEEHDGSVDGSHCAAPLLLSPLHAGANAIATATNVERVSAMWMERRMIVLLVRFRQCSGKTQ